MRIAVIGSGIAGLSAARALAGRHHVTVFERADRPGGHVRTVTVEATGQTLALDTGFVVFNRRNYPGLTRLFRELEIETQPSDMSFAVSLDDAGKRIEWAGGNGILGLFAQGRRTADPRHWRMLAGILRFNRYARDALARGAVPGTLREFLRAGGHDRIVAERYLVPMAAAIWSCPPGRMLDAPASSLLAFFRNHGLLEVTGRPGWRTVRGGSSRYVKRLLASGGFEVRCGTPVERIDRRGGSPTVEWGGRRERFDACVLACHADESLALLADASPRESRVLGAFRFEDNFAFLHRDPRLMPVARRAWASWNVRLDTGGGDHAGVAVTYWLNRLQRLGVREDYFVSLNPAVRPRQPLAAMRYTHPVLDTAAVAGQRQLPEIQGTGGCVYAGAWTRYGFHEDGFVSGLEAARRLDVGDNRERAAS